MSAAPAPSLETRAPLVERRTYFLGRQPILDRSGRIVAHDLLFRDARETQRAAFDDAVQATAHVLVSTFGVFGMETILGGLPGFVNVDPRLEVAEHLDALPEAEIVFDLPQDVVIDDLLIERLRRLRQRGFQVCLDGFVYKDSRESLLPYSHYAKVDVTRSSPIELRKIARQLSRENVDRIATRVETAEAHRLVEKQGWELVQGYYFARPETVAMTRAAVHRSSLVELIASIGAETPIDEVVDRLRVVPHLTMNLLSMANLMRAAAGQKIESLQQAIVMIGHKQLMHWLHLLLFASDDQNGCANPLCRLAAVRGKTMEMLARLYAERNVGEGELDPDQASLTGMLSLAPALLGLSPKEVSRKLGLDYSIEAALMRREGLLGKLLQLREALEASDLPGAGALLAELGLGADELQRSELEAAAWVNGLSSVPTNQAARAALL